MHAAEAVCILEKKLWFNNRKLQDYRLWKTFLFWYVDGKHNLGTMRRAAGPVFRDTPKKSVHVASIERQSKQW